MATPNMPPAMPGKLTALVGLGILVVAIGFLVPRFLSPTPVSSAAAPQPAEPIQNFAMPTPSSDGPSLGMSLFKMVLGVAVISGACIGIARFMKKRTVAPTAGAMEVVARLALDRRCVLHLVQSGQRRLLLGLDASGAKALLEIPGPVPTAVLSAKVAVPSRFAAVLATVD